MKPSLPISAKHTDFVYKQLLRADELYDQDPLDECVKILYNLIGNYDMASFPRLKTLGTLSELMCDWEYAEACRQEAEHLYERCSKHPDRYNPSVLAKFRAPLDALAKAWANKLVSKMSDEEVEFRLRRVGRVVKNQPSSDPSGPQTSEQTAEIVRTTKR